MSFRITLDWLREKNACADARQEFARLFPDGGDVEAVAEWVERDRPAWWLWLAATLPCDASVLIQCGPARFQRTFEAAKLAEKASSGDLSKAASSGNLSTAASSGDYSTAASSGNYSTAASSGENTIAMAAGFNCTVRAGVGGCFASCWTDHSGRIRIAVGYVGEGGINADTPYRLDSEGNWQEAR